MDASTAGTLQRSFDAITDRDAAMCMELRKRKAMLRYVQPLLLTFPVLIIW